MSPLDWPDNVRARFEAKFQRGAPGDCWEWRAGRRSSGYGGFAVSVNGRRAHYDAHSVSLRLHLGRELGDGLWALHHCDNRACVNPAHLYEGTRTQNMHDAIRRGRMPGVCVSEADVRMARGLRELGWTIRDIADLIGCSKSHASRIASGVQRREVAS